MVKMYRETAWVDIGSRTHCFSLSLVASETVLDPFVQAKFYILHSNVSKLMSDLNNATGSPSSCCMVFYGCYSVTFDSLKK